jgi:hypothetical protein
LKIDTDPTPLECVGEPPLVRRTATLTQAVLPFELSTLNRVFALITDNSRKSP